jgi:hypothetical protein
MSLAYELQSTAVLSGVPIGRPIANTESLFLIPNCSQQRLVFPVRFSLAEKDWPAGISIVRT